MKIRLIALFLLLLQGCAVYQYEHKMDGSCSLYISSMREVKAGDLKISKSCALSGNAEVLGANEKLIDLVVGVVTKAK